jgi:signal transduction histidine kinase
MHDGVAQDLAFLGYRLDSLRTRATQLDPELGASVAELRGEMTELISNLRLSITDLRTSVTSDRGLGAALTSYIRAAGSGRQLTVHLSLKESPFRLPADREVVLFRIAQLVTQDVRETGDADNLWVTLRVDPPSAHLRVEHDGSFDENRHGVAPLLAVMEGHGGTVHVRPRHGGGVLVDALFGGEGDGNPGAAG